MKILKFNTFINESEDNDPFEGIKQECKLYEYKEEKTSEKIVIDVEVGDTVYLGKFKNKKTIIKKIDKDETGMPTINGKKVVTFRIQEPKKNPNFKGYRSRFKKKKKED